MSKARSRGRAKCVFFNYQFLPPELLAIGDLIRTDIYGANLHGFHSAIVKTGANKDDIDLKSYMQNGYMNQYDCPNWVLDSLAW